MSKVIKIKCAKCKKEFNYYDSEFRPFCTERCKQIDLGMWFNEAYTVASTQPLSESDIEHVLKEEESKLNEED